MELCTLYIATLSNVQWPQLCNGAYKRVHLLHAVPGDMERFELLAVVVALDAVW